MRNELHSFLFGKGHGSPPAALPSGPPDRISLAAPRQRHGSPPRSEAFASEYARSEFEAFDVRSELASSEIAGEMGGGPGGELGGGMGRTLATLRGEGVGGDAGELSDAQRLAQAHLGDALARAQLSRHGPGSHPGELAEKGGFGAFFI